MKHAKLILTTLFVLAVSTTTLSFILYSEHKTINDTQVELSNIGHDLIDVRDNVVLNSLATTSDPYRLTRDIVNIQKEAQSLTSKHNEDGSRLFIFKDDTQSILTDFYTSTKLASTTLERLVGSIVARDSVFLAMDIKSDSIQLILNQITSTDTNPTSINTYDEQHTTILLDLIDQKKTYLSSLLNHSSVGFVENSEKHLMQLSQQARDLSASTIFLTLLLLACIGSVITHQRRLELIENNRLYKESAEKTAEAIKAKSLFLATMSHELRTPMNGVLGVAQIIAETTKETDNREHANTIVESGEHLVTILNDILDFSKAEQGKLTLENRPFKFNEIIDSVDSMIKPLALNKNITLEFNVEIEPTATAQGDPSRIRQILFNILGNAIKFTQEGGVSVHISSNPTNDEVVIKILDTGVGIKRDRLATIFNPFEQADLSTTREFGGTGLGLSIVKQLIDTMGGEISVFSQINVGTEFTIKLPITISHHK